MLNNPRDAAVSAEMRANQADPLIMYLVARRELLPQTALDEILAISATTVVAADRRFAAEARYADLFAQWHALSYRKVTLRAKENEWARLLRDFELCSGQRSDGEPLLAVLPVRRKSEVEAWLRGLQVLDQALPAYPPSFAPARSEPAALLALNPGLSMSLGKAMAQVGHAGLMLADAALELPGGADWAPDLAAWAAAGYPFELLQPSLNGWAAAEQIPSVAVVDAGLTEIAAGSRTVLASRPAQATERRVWAKLLQV